MVVKAKTQTIFGVELAPMEQNSEEEIKWYIKDFTERKRIGIYSIYTLKDWKCILQTVLKKESV